MTYISSPDPSPSLVTHQGGFIINKDVRLPNGVTFTKLGVYSAARTISLKIVKDLGGQSYDVLVSETFAHAGGGWQDVDLSTPFEVPATGDYYIGYFFESGTINYLTGVDRAYIWDDADPLGVYNNFAENNGTTGSVRAYSSDLVAPVNATFEVLGVIRNDGSGWAVIEDSGHKSLNILSVVDTGSALRLSYLEVASQVGTLLISPDETFAQAGYSAGASVGLSHADIKFGLNGVAKNPSQVVSANGNFWIYGKMWS